MLNVFFTSSTQLHWGRCELGHWNRWESLHLSRNDTEHEPCLRTTWFLCRSVYTVIVTVLSKSPNLCCVVFPCSACLLEGYLLRSNIIVAPGDCTSDPSQMDGPDTVIAFELALN